MGFVFIFRSQSERRRADKLAKALRERSLEVCVGLEREPAEVRPSVSRSLADHCSAMVAICTEQDLSDPAFIEPMRHAASRGKLIALAASGASPPANLGPTIEVSQNWANSAAELSAVCDAVAEVRARNTPPGEFPGAGPTAAEEYAAYGRMHRAGTVDAMAQFLRTYPGGIFEEIVRAELDAATRPSYEPARAHFGGGDASGEREAAQVWRMGDWSPWRALRGFAKFWPWAGAAALAIAALALATLAPWPAVQAALGNFTEGQSREAAERPSATVRIEPAAALGAETPPVPQIQTAEAADLAAITRSLPAAEFANAGVEDVAEPPPEPVREPVQVAAAATQPPPVLQQAPAQTPPTQPPPPPTTRVAAAGVAYDVAQLEPVLLQALEQARRNQERALAAARRGQARTVAARANAGAGEYFGDWSAGGANGQGRAVWTNGDSYAGAWRASRPHGYGVMNLAGGLRYEGEFAEGTPTGRGVFWSADGRRLTGDTLFAALVRARTR